MKYLKLALITLLVVNLTSCGESLKSEHMADQKGIDKIIEKVGKIITEENVKAVEIRAAKSLDPGFGEVYATYKRDDAYYTISYGAKLNDPIEAVVLASDKKDYEKAASKKLSDFKFNDVVATYNKAIEQIKSEVEEELENFTLYSIEKKIKADGTFSTEITIQATKKGEAAKREGRNLVTNYYEAKAKVNTDGTLTITY